MKEDLYKLLSIRSISTNKDQLIQAIDFIEGFFTKSEAFVTRHEYNGSHSIVITSKNTKTPDIFLSGHIDVVGANYDRAFEPYEKEGKIYARGTCDMKGAVIAMMYAFRELLEEGEDIDIGLMVTSDEELGGPNGVVKLLDYGYSANCAFVPDSADNWNICTDEKGGWHLKITTSGVEGHGSRPWNGENAVDKAINIYKSIAKEFENRWGKATKDNSWIPTINIGKIEGGHSTNSIPGKAEILLDLRYTQSQSLDEIEKIVNKSVDEFNGEIQSIVKFTALHTDQKNEYIQKWKKLIKEFVGYDSKFIKGFGSSDARFFSAKRIPTFLSLPRASASHITDEWIDYDDLVKFKDIIKMWIIKSIQ